MRFRDAVTGSLSSCFYSGDEKMRFRDAVTRSLSLFPSCFSSGDEKIKFGMLRKSSEVFPGRGKKPTTEMSFM